MSVQVVTIDLLGTSFTVQTDESLDYMEGLLSRLKSRHEQLRVSTRVADPLKLSILAGITLMDELIRERGKRAEIEGRRAEAPGIDSGSNEGRAADEAELDRIAARLIADLDRSLGLMTEEQRARPVLERGEGNRYSDPTTENTGEQA